MGVAALVKAAKSYTKTKTKTSNPTRCIQNTGPQCTQRIGYRKTRMPAAKRRSWVNFKRKVRAVEASNHTSSTFTKTNIQRRFSTSNYSQATCAIGLLSRDGAATKSDDMRSLYIYLAGRLGTATSSNDNNTNLATYWLTERSLAFKFTALIWNVNITNNLPSNATVDLYECIVKRDIPLFPAQPDGDNTIDNFITSLSNQATADGKNAVIPTANTGTFSLNGLYDTPFNNPLFGRWLTVKRIRNMHIPGNGSCRMQVRQPRDRIIRASACRGLIHAKGDIVWFYQCRGPPGLDVPVTTAGATATPVPATPCDLTFTDSRTYRFYEEGFNRTVIGGIQTTTN